MNINLLLLLWLSVLATSRNNDSQIITKIKTDVRYLDKSLDASSIYFIEAKKTSTSNESEYDKCQVEPKKVLVKEDVEKFRLTFNMNRKQSIFQELTTLTDQETTIESFEIIDQYIFVLISNGTAYFLKNDLNFAKNPHKIDTQIQLRTDIEKKFPFIQAYKGNALVATNKEIVICQPDQNSCEKMADLENISVLTKFYLFEKFGKTYVFLCQGISLTVFELNSENKLINQKHYNSTSFSVPRLYISEIIPTQGNEILILDFYQGIMKVNHEENDLATFHKNSTFIYKQFGCRSMDSMKNGDYLVMQCTLNHKSYFILQLIKNHNFGTYEAQQPIFQDEILMDVTFNDKIIMVQTFSGVKLFWSSPQLQSPYPYDHHYAGNIFLHNAIRAKIMAKNGRTQIYISTEDQLRIYQLTQKNAGILCYSLVPIKEQYTITFKYKCDMKSHPNQICQKESSISFEAWEHKEVKFKTMLIPFIISLILIIFTTVCIFKVREKYKEEVEAAVLKYNADNDFELDSNR